MSGKKTVFVVLIILLFGILFACTGVKFDDLTIVAENVTEIPVGEYTLVYSINDLESYAQNYDLEIKVKVFDQDNKEITIKNNRTINIEADCTYTVVIYCSTLVNDSTVTKSKQFTITAIKSSPTITLTLKDGDYSFLYRTITVNYGDSYLLANIPECPNYYPNPTDGVTRIITSKKWIVFDESGNEIDLTQEHLNNIVTNINIFGSYVYNVTETPIVYTFVANGGSETTKISGSRLSTVNRPLNPTKANYTFDCWCTDEALTTPYNWKENTIFKKNTTLYARWLLEVTGMTSTDKFNYELNTDNNGNDYYAIFPKDKTEMTSALVIPNGYNNIPVKRIGGDINNGFSDCDISSVYIPDTITTLAQASFQNCDSLTYVTFEQGSKMSVLGDQAFENCSKLSTIENLPENLTDLGATSFKNCLKLTSFTLPSKLTSLKTDVFFGCTLLTEISVPDTVIQITQNAFKSSGLTTITFTENSSLVSFDSSALTDTNVTAIKLPYFFYKENINPFSETTISVIYYTDPVD